MARRLSTPEHHMVLSPLSYYGMAPPPVPSPRRGSMPVDMLAGRTGEQSRAVPFHVTPAVSTVGRRSSADYRGAAMMVPVDHRSSGSYMPAIPGVPLPVLGPVHGHGGGGRRTSGGVLHNVDNFLAQQGLERKRMPNDATCMYRAAADQVLFSSAQYPVLRNAVLSFIHENPVRYAHCTSGLTLDDFVKALREERQSGTLVELDALSHVLQRDVMVYYAADKPPFNQTANNFPDHLFLVANLPSSAATSHAGTAIPHFDSVMPKKWSNTAAYCQMMLYEMLGAALGCEFTKELEDTHRGYKNLAMDSSSRRSSGQNSPGQIRRKNKEAAAKRELEAAAGISQDPSDHSATPPVPPAPAPTFDPSNPGRRLEVGEGPDFTARRQRGRVKFFNCQKGYGFLVPNDGGVDIFVHHTVIGASDNGNHSLLDNDEVEFCLVPGPKGPQASLVTAVGGGPVRGGDPVAPIQVAVPSGSIKGPIAVLAPGGAPPPGTPYFVQPQIFVPQPYAQASFPAQQPIYYQYLPGYPSAGSPEFIQPYFDRGAYHQMRYYGMPAPHNGALRSPTATATIEE